MKTLLSFASSLFSSVGLSGCSAPTISDTRYLDVADLSDYFAQVRDKAVVYFVCGQAVQKNPMFGVVDMSENFWCSFSVNGQTYEKLNTGVIAKLVLEPGQYTSIAFAETLVLEGIAASIGSVGDAYDNALAESTIGLFKTEAVSKRSPFLSGPMKTIDDVEFATMGWVDWFNQRRLHSTLDYLTPDEFEEVYYSQESALHPEMLQA